MILRRLSFALLLSSLLASLSSGIAEARTSRKVSHSYERVWPTTVRFLRVDEGLKILEKDVDTGYVLFELEDEGKRFSGSIEVIRRKDSSQRDSVELILQISDRPSYMEHSILDRMLKKIRTELGIPKEAPKKPAPEPEPAPEPKPSET